MPRLEVHCRRLSRTLTAVSLRHYFRPQPRALTYRMYLPSLAHHQAHLGAKCQTAAVIAPPLWFFSSLLFSSPPYLNSTTLNTPLLSTIPVYTTLKTSLLSSLTTLTT
ncbi:hypothetical protein Pmani_014977 [Petrolisthes manimaculis]|uniref:Uncharacterized protein n=1 Tax=Petrolisthes manimaculis TaxID=1843537 RepID=A0AAE1PT54_9EUCA|nr:hypothetical protein Pmani_014977 [Petrolisthes manimaculis]